MILACDKFSENFLNGKPVYRIGEPVLVAKMNIKKVEYFTTDKDYIKLLRYLKIVAYPMYHTPCISNNKQFYFRNSDLDINVFKIKNNQVIKISDDNPYLFKTPVEYNINDELSKIYTNLILTDSIINELKRMLPIYAPENEYSFNSLIRQIKIKSMIESFD